MVGKVRVTDSKGRLTLGHKYANRTVIVRERRDASLVVEPAQAIPDREAWLYANPKALASVQRGLDQLVRGKYVPGPDMKAALELADQCADE